MSQKSSVVGHKEKLQMEDNALRILNLTIHSASSPPPPAPSSLLLLLPPNFCFSSSLLGPGTSNGFAHAPPEHGWQGPTLLLNFPRDSGL
eukprot:751344-Hanusia_phi.AAC.4